MITDEFQGRFQSGIASGALAKKNLRVKDESVILRRQSCPGGGIGRRAGFKIQFRQRSAGSIPAPGTQFNKRDLISKVEIGGLDFFYGVRAFVLLDIIPGSVLRILM